MALKVAPPDQWHADEYALLAFGEGRKLERFGGLILDRPSPAAWNSSSYPAKATREKWPAADIRLDAAGRPIAGALPTSPWQARHGQLVFNLKLTPFGHVGLFPEQAPNWQWLANWCQGFTHSFHRAPRALNLFGYTGGSTLAMAAAGAEVVHVDASAPAVRWARQNAADSNLAAHPIRWIVDDARKFVARELRRERVYDLVVLDPPSHGHGPEGTRWSIERDLPKLLRECTKLLSSGAAALLLTGHSETVDQQRCALWLDDCGTARMPAARLQHLELGRLGLVDERRQTLDAGFFVRAQRTTATTA